MVFVSYRGRTPNVGIVWIVVGKFALVAFLVVACLVLVITYVRNARRGGRPRPTASGYLASIRGSMPPTPLPEWVNWDEQPGDHGAGGGA
jgi:hypothetical protein